MQDAKVAVVKELVEALSRRCEEISASNHSPVILLGVAPGACFLRGLDSTFLTMEWQAMDSSRLAESKIRASIYEGPPSLFGHRIIKQGKCIRVSIFAFRQSHDRPGYFEGHEKYDAQQLAEKLIRWYRDEATKALQRRMRFGRLDRSW